MLILAIILVLQELVLRFAFPMPELCNFDRSNYLPGVKKDKAYAYYRNSKWFWESVLDTNCQFIHHLNKYGFRDNDWSIEEEKGRQRILLIGDSFTEGVMVDQQHTVAEVIKKEDTGGSFEIMNMGIMGTGLNSYLKLMVDAIPIFKPDKVCLLLYSNDLSSKRPIIPEKGSDEERYNLYLPRLIELILQIQEGNPVPFRFLAEEKPFLPSMHDKNFPWRNRERIMIRNTTYEVQKNMAEGKVNPFKVDQILREKKGLSEQPQLGQMMQFLKEYGEEHQVEILVSYIPARHQVTNHYYKFDKDFCRINCPDELDLTGELYNQHQDYLERLCKENRLKFMDFTSLIKAQEKLGNRLYWNYDDHMNNKGYELLGKGLYRFIAGS